LTAAAIFIDDGKVSFAAKRRSCKLAATVGDHLVDVHVELSSAARHPNVQGKHIVVPASEDLVARLHDQFVTLIVEAFAGVVCDGSGLLQSRVGGYHFSGN
jgi:hypothetical protein